MRPMIHRKSKENQDSNKCIGTKIHVCSPQNLLHYTGQERTSRCVRTVCEELYTFSPISVAHQHMSAPLSAGFRMWRQFCPERMHRRPRSPGSRRRGQRAEHEGWVRQGDISELSFQQPWEVGLHSSQLTGLEEGSLLPPATPTSHTLHRTPRAHHQL